LHGAPVEFLSPPGALGLTLKSLFDRRPRRLVPGTVAPALRATTGAANPDRRRLAAYRDLCGLPQDDRLPLTWPHVLCGGLRLALLLQPSFPVRLPGLVHLSHRIEQLATLDDGATLAFDCRLEGGRPTERGDEFLLATSASAGGRVAWRETMTFVVPARRTRPPPPQRPPLPTVLAEWDAPADVGRRYARVSGDWNPIHLAGFLARRFGFPGAIAHGMWSLARCRSALPGPDGAGARLEARFLRPLALPGRVRLHAGPGETAGTTAFWLVSVNDETPHLRGQWRPGGACDEPVLRRDGWTGVVGGAGVT
jgi:acyl dehydratase